MTEDQIERLVEKQTDSFDNQLMNGTLTQKEYDKEMRLLNRWAEEEYNKIKKKD